MRKAFHWVGAVVLIPLGAWVGTGLPSQDGGPATGDSAQTPARTQEDLPPLLTQEDLPPLLKDELLICRDRKVASSKQYGLYWLDDEGEMRRVWKGEPFDALWLLDKSILVTERWTGRVLELNSSFEVVRTLTGFREPVDVEKTETGLWVILENDPGRVVAVNPETGERVWTRSGFRSPFDMALLADGGLLVADSSANRVVRLDKQGKQTLVVQGIRFPNTVDATEDGGFLVSDWTGGNVRRYDAAGALLWRTSVGGTLQSADERPDGRVVVTEGYGGKVYYLDPEGRLEATVDFPLGCVDGELILRL